MSVAKCLVTARLALSYVAGAQAQDERIVKIAVIDPLSGMSAVTSLNQLKTAEFFADILNCSRGLSGSRFEIIGLDSKLSPEEAVARTSRH